MQENTIILACSTLRQELELVMDRLLCSYPVEWVDSGLHVWPDSLRINIQKKLDELDPKYTTVLMLFGFCGNSMVGINSNDRTIILPLAADCIPIFLGSQEERDRAGMDTYFFTAGYLNFETTMVSEFKRAITKYGQKRGSSIMRALMAHYKRLAVVDTGAFEVQAVVDGVKELSDELEIPTVVLQGNLRIIENLLLGNWQEEDFLIVRPGGSIKLEDSLSVGKSLIC